MFAETKISIAPMIDWTDRHCRTFHRALSKHAVLYTEMIVDKAILHGDRDRIIDARSPKDRVVLQLGGSAPNELAEAVRIAHDVGYSQINLNCGCPSDRVQSGTFGAVLMRDPVQVERALQAMRAASPANISVKCRLGVDDQDVETTLPLFLTHVRNSGVKDVTIHARKAWLQGLSPKQNRDIPPLDYDLAAQMREQFPELRIELNGGIASLDQAKEHIKSGFPSVMIGRAAYHQPYEILANVDTHWHGEKTMPSRLEIVDFMANYADEHIANGGRLHHISRHMIGLYHGCPGAQNWRRGLSMDATHPDASGAHLRALAASMPF